MEISAEEWPDKRQEVRKAVLGAEVIAMDFEFTGTDRGERLILTPY